jgi:non-canonical poly(A) RNA polymerase PAPD5/7
MAHSDRITVLHALANTLKRAGITEKVTIIAKAKVPIIKFVTTYGYFPVDISINQENGIVVGRVVSGFLSEMPALRALILVVKAFLNQRSMNEVFTGGLGSYSIVCLAVSFLQMHPKIRRGEIDPGRNLGVLVMEFFEFYGYYFNYHEVGISLRDGGTYFSKAQRGWVDYKQSLLSIEDPADASELRVSSAKHGVQRVVLWCSKRYFQGFIWYRTSAPDVRRRTRYHDGSRIYESWHIEFTAIGAIGQAARIRGAHRSEHIVECLGCHSRGTWD